MKELTESTFHPKIYPFERKSKTDALRVVMVIGSAYGNLRFWDPILKYLAQYAVWKLEPLQGAG